MKVLKKAVAVLLSVCLALPFAYIHVDAAEGSLTFSDPTTKVGENVSIDMAIEAGGAALGDADVTISYDTAALEFVSGAGVQTDGSGKLRYTGSGTGSETELRTTLEFKALKAGDTSVTIDSYTAYLYSDETLNLAEGSSAVKVDAADDGSTSIEGSASAQTAAATDIKVTVDGTEYSFSEAFTSSDIPEGYTETKLTFNGADRKFVCSEGGVYLGYLVDASGVGSFFLYNEEDATFSPYVEIAISDTTSIILLNDPKAVSLPKAYQETELMVLDQTFPTWNDAASSSRYYIIYALNTRTGEKGLYQYDIEDETYQNFEAPEVTEEKVDNSFLGKVKDFVAKHLLLAMAAGTVLVLLLLILVIVLAIKVFHRNQELDDLYEEYDIPLEDERQEKAQTTDRSRKQFVGYEDEDEYEDEYDDEYYDDEYEDDAYEDEYYDEEDEFDDEYEEEVSRTSRKGQGRKNRSDKEDDYDIDFIDL
ncbi:MULTISPECIES: cohesin domain-containing protein [Mediterraneibacter]|uniref:cohesin domain-containing protein n=1 Tax=Mediterraneibacter TaxID=2316020 RepID=UPI000E51EFCC|nr:cohesin domain-containing protein [Mediterraneibacter massiliensis]RGT71549.1 hypothetical protein DWX08_12920 [Ruminococcus sp. AF18-22]